MEGEFDGCVTELQDLLNQHGAGLSVDGDVGANTLSAVKSFQSAHGLGVDGQVGPQTKAALTGSAPPTGNPPPPSPADCAADGCDPACWTATQNGTPGYNGLGVAGSGVRRIRRTRAAWGRRAWRSSVWRLTEAGWRMYLHQGTLAAGPDDA